MIKSLEIIKVKISDLEVLENVSKQSFIETYADKNTAENMENYLSENFAPDKLQIQINNQQTQFYLAQLNNKTVGYLKINFGKAQTEKQNNKTVEIERIYVLKEFQGKKIGQLFCDKAVQIGKQKTLDYIWLGVWEENLKAINFYKKYGFVEFDKHIFKLGEDEQIDIMMKLEL